MSKMKRFLEERQPERIQEALGLLQQIWEKQPETRFFQLLHNLEVECRDKLELKGVEVYQKAADSDSYVMFEKKILYDLYNTEDDDFILFLKQKIEEEPPNE